MTLPLKGKPGLRATAAGFLIRSPGARLHRGSQFWDRCVQICRPLGQQMKAYHSVMPAAVTRLPLADMKRVPTEADAPRLDNENSSPN